MKVYDFDPRNLPQELLTALGLVVASAAYAEDIIDQAIGGMSRLDFEYTGCLTTHMTMPIRFKALRSTAKITLPKEDYDTLLDIVSRLEKAFDERNAIVHNVWVTDPGGGETILLKETASREYKIDLIAKSTRAVQTVAANLYAVAMELYVFIGARGLHPDLDAVAQRRQRNGE